MPTCLPQSLPSNLLKKRGEGIHFVYVSMYTSEYKCPQSPEASDALELEKQVAVRSLTQSAFWEF